MKILLCALLIFGTAAIAAPATNITGKWDFTVETSQGGGSPKFDFKQDGETLTGTYEGAFGQAKINGTVKGNQVEFKVAVESGDYSYSGTIQDDGTIKGKVKLAELGEGTFTGKRAK